MWCVRDATELYPNQLQFPEDVSIAQISEYNVTINSNSAFCTDNVTLKCYPTCTLYCVHNKNWKWCYVWVTQIEVRGPETTTTHDVNTYNTIITELRQANQFTLMLAVAIIGHFYQQLIMYFELIYTMSTYFFYTSTFTLLPI